MSNNNGFSLNISLQPTLERSGKVNTINNLSIPILT